jgi:hypothetical protein
MRSASASPRVPSYRKHKASGQAVVTLGGKDFYLGKHNSAGSKAEYHRLIAEWQVAGDIEQANDTTVVELLVLFARAIKKSHSKKDQENFVLAMRPLKALYGHTVINEFGPVALQAVRQQMIQRRASSEGDQPADRPTPLRLQVGRSQPARSRQRVDSSESSRGAALWAQRGKGNRTRPAGRCGPRRRSAAVRLAASGGHDRAATCHWHAVR